MTTVRMKRALLEAGLTAAELAACPPEQIASLYRALSYAGR